jgi:ribonucleoside-triphosphate reductase
MNLKQVETKLRELEAEKAAIEGTETEVYARIVGYYRAVRNWNRGKKAEYAERVPFTQWDVESAANDVPATPVGEEEFQAELGFDRGTAGYIYFYRKTCPNCPPVAAWLQELDMTGRSVDVDEESGLQEAGIFDVVSAPTVIFHDDEGRVTARGCKVADLEKVLGLETQPVS